MRRAAPTFLAAVLLVATVVKGSVSNAQMSDASRGQFALVPDGPEECSGRTTSSRRSARCSPAVPPRGRASGERQSPSRAGRGVARRADDRDGGRGRPSGAHRGVVSSRGRRDGVLILAPRRRSRARRFESSGAWRPHRLPRYRRLLRATCPSTGVVLAAITTASSPARAPDGCREPAAGRLDPAPSDDLRDRGGAQALEDGHAPTVAPDVMLTAAVGMGFAPRLRFSATGALSELQPANAAPASVS